MNEAWFLAVRLLSTALDVLVGLLALAWVARSAGRWPFAARLGWALSAALAALLLKLPLWAALGLRLFAWVHLGFLHMVVVPPLLVLAAFFLERRRRAGWARGRAVVVVVVLGAGVLPALGAYASFIEPFDLRLETAHIPVARGLREPLRVGVLADIQTAHVTAHEWRAIDLMMAQRPDLILLPGDLFHGASQTLAANLPDLRALMGRLWAPGGVYFVLGDADSEEEAAQVFAGSAVEVLINRTHRTVVKGQPVTIAGIELDWRRPAAVAFLRTLEAEPASDDLRLLVAHRPDVVLDLPQASRVDLVVAGHTHGGQVKLPFFGPPIILSQVPRAVGGGGYHHVAGRPIYVSRGVGFEGGKAPRIRFLCPPEVSLLVIAADGR